jgi:uncharacterized protein YutE (UPF0331/DUF86 family)/predicted nucleotidyltransferase
VEVLERVKKQVDLVLGLLSELEYEKSYRGIERLVQLVIQGVLDLGLMIIAALSAKRPRGYSEVGFVLRDLGVLCEDDASLLKSMAGLRNILVHEYVFIDRDRIREYANRLKHDVPRLVASMLKGLENRQLDPPIRDIEELTGRLRSVLHGRVVLALLYGGRVKRYSLKGDVDIAVLMSNACDLHKLGELVVDVANALGVPEEKVDIVCLDMLPLDHAWEALNGVPIVVEDRRQLFELKWITLVQLLDFEEDWENACRALGWGERGSGHDMDGGGSGGENPRETIY